MTPLWHGVELCRTLSLGTADLGGAAVHVAYLLAFALAGLRGRPADLPEAAQ